MRLIITFSCLATACITDNGDIDIVCDEIPAPCVWEDPETEDSGEQDAEPDDTGSADQ